MSRSRMIEDDLSISLPQHKILSTPVLIDAIKFYAHHGALVKNKVDALAVEIKDKSERMRNVHAIIQEINNLSTDDGTNLNISGNQALLDKLNLAKQHGIQLPMNADNLKTEFTPAQRDRLIENLHLSADEWDKDIKSHSQKMQVHMQESDRYLMMANQIQKAEERPKKAMIQGIRGQ